MRHILHLWSPRFGLLLAAFLGITNSTYSQEDESKLLVPQSETPPSFFTPPAEGVYDQVPEAEGQESGGAFWTPADDAFFDSLPRALDPSGAPTGDYDESIWQREFGEIQAAADQEEWIQSRGYLEYRGQYSTNIDSSAPGVDFDLRRKGQPFEIFNTEVSDWSNGLTLGYDHEFAIVPDKMKGAARYEFSHQDYADEDRENETYHFMELATITKLTDDLEWEIYGGALFDDRRNDAQYFAADYDQWHVGNELVQNFDEGKRLTAGYEFRHRDYETVRGGSIVDGVFFSEVTPFFDWHEHRFWSTYSHPLNDCLTLDAGMTFTRRNYESITLDERGRPVDFADPSLTEFRQYKSYEPIVALRIEPTEHTRLIPYYRYQSLQSTGSFYDYEQNGWGVTLNQDLCPDRVPGLRLIAQFEYAEKDYDAQIIRSAGGLRTGSVVRDDETVRLYVALERTIRDCLTTGVDFYYIDNDSSDDSSRYQEDRYGVYVRYDF